MGLNYHGSDRWGARGLLGFQAETDNASNYDVTLSAFTWQLLPYWRKDRFHVAAGLIGHNNIELDMDSLGTATFRDAVGLEVEAGYYLFSIAFTSMEYEAEVSGAKFDADSVILKFHLPLDY